MELRGTSIRVFLPDGDPTGLRIVERSNWTGIVLVASKADLTRLRKRDEVQGPGVYLLVGRSDQDLPEIYIGEADSVAVRLASHVRSDKDFWNEAVVISTKDANFNKASARWLESQLILLAQRANRSVIHNGNQGAPVHLSEADEADMHAFLDDVRILLPILGILAFEPPGSSQRSKSETELYLRGRGSDAVGYESSEGFVVKEGATGPGTEVPSIGESARTRRHQLIEAGLLVREGDRVRLTRDVAFGSPSTAATMIMGRNTNGRLQWKSREGKTLKEIQEAELGEIGQDQPLRSESALSD